MVCCFGLELKVIAGSGVGELGGDEMNRSVQLVSNKPIVRVGKERMRVRREYRGFIAVLAVLVLVLAVRE